MSVVEELKAEQPAAKKMKLDAKCLLRWAKLTDQALEPVRGSARAAGLDLRSAYDVVVPARGKALVKTDLQVQVPEGSYGRVAPRSGLAVKNFIDVGAGVVDEDYRGNLGVVLFNHSDEKFDVKRGDRIAQFICERIFYPELEQVDKLEETVRGEGGFGSTGVKGGAPEDADKLQKNGASVAKADKTAEKKEDKVEKTAGKKEDKVEKTAEKKEDKVEKTAGKKEVKVEKTVGKKDDKVEKMEEDTKQEAAA